jgi:hypothetical protein
MTGVRGIIGSVLIDRGLSLFDSATKKLDEGIKHCQIDIEKHEGLIKQSKEQIGTLQININRATRVKDRIKALIS